MSRISHLPPGLHIGKLSDTGRVRECNEDSLFSVESLIQHSNGREPFGLFVVADGMGGHQKGELASELAIRTAATHILRDVYLPYLDHDRSSANRPINEALITAVESANTAIQNELPEGGTTLTLALIMGSSAYIAHVGDSRAYLFHKNNIKQITTDHSYVQRLVELGQETPESALNHIHRNVLYRALGQGGGSVEVDTYVQYLPPGSSLVLCSDGLWGLVDDSTLKDIVGSADTPQEACQRLITAANERGGDDNITVIIVSTGVEGEIASENSQSG